MAGATMWRARLREYLGAELPDSIGEWPRAWLDEFDERAAIMEYDADMPREQAEAWAETIVRAAYRLDHKRRP